MKNKGFIAVTAVVLLNIGAALGLWIHLTKIMRNKDKEKKSYSSYYFITNQWLMNKFSEKRMSGFFESNGYSRIAIYGAGSLAELLYLELEGTDVKIEYFIDKKAGEFETAFGGIECVDIDGIAEMPEVDAIIVTPVAYMEEISKSLKRTSADVISIEDIVYSL